MSLNVQNKKHKSEKKFSRAIFYLLVIIVLVIPLLILLTGCQTDSSNRNQPENDRDTGSPAQDRADETNNGNSINARTSQIAPLSKWLPEQTFNSLIWGEYSVVSLRKNEIRDQIEILDEFLDGMKFERIPTDITDDDEVPIFPLVLSAGPENTHTKISANLRKLGYELLNYTVLSKEAPASSPIRWMNMPYKIEANKIIIFPDWSHQFVDPNPNATQIWDSIININTEKTIEFEFYFEGRDLVLLRDGLFVRMKPNSWAVGNYFTTENDHMRIDHHLNIGYEPLFDIAFMTIFISNVHDLNLQYIDRAYVYFEHDYIRTRLIAIEPEMLAFDDGTMRISWTGRQNESREIEPDPTEIWVNYIWCGGTSGDGVILIDGHGNVYPYQLNRRHYNEALLVDSIDIPVDNLTDREIEDLIVVHQNILEKLQIAFSDAGIDAEIDPVTGRVTMDNSILFGLNEFELSDAGSNYLDGFLDVYASVVLDEEFSGGIAEILVEGHTCSDGSDASNQTLSENRANAVAGYCLERQPGLANIMVTKGLASGQPVLDANGNEDKPASRRVVFKFILNTNT